VMGAGSSELKMGGIGTDSTATLKEGINTQKIGGAEVILKRGSGHRVKGTTGEVGEG